MSEFSPEELSKIDRVKVDACVERRCYSGGAGAQWLVLGLSYSPLTKYSVVPPPHVYKYDNAVIPVLVLCCSKCHSIKTLAWKPIRDGK